MTMRGPYADQSTPDTALAADPDPSAVARAFADLALERNLERQDNYREAVEHAFDDAKERFRDARGELPAPGSDPLFDAMAAVIEQLESSPEALRAACDRLRELT